MSILHKMIRSAEFYTLPPGHIFAIRHPEERLYEFVSRNHDGVTLRRAEPPHLCEELSSADFDDLVKRGLVDPRMDASALTHGHHRPYAGVRLGDLTSDDREAVEFYFELCRRVYDKYRAHELQLTDASLKENLPKIAGELMYRGEAGSRLSKGGPARRGSKKTAPSSEQKILARKRHAVFHLPSPSTIRSYIRRLEDSSWDPVKIRDLRKGRRRQVGSRYDTSAWDIMGPWVKAYMCKSKPSKALLYKLMQGSLYLADVNLTRQRNNKRTVPVDDLRTFAIENAERAHKGMDLLPIPSRRTFEREIEKLDPFHVVTARDGENAARRKFRVGGSREGALTAAEKVLIDCWRVQLMSLKLPGQFWAGLAEEEISQLKRLRFAVCVAMCEASKVILGIRICLNPNEETAIETLEMICRDKASITKAAGCIGTFPQAVTPGELGGDNGSEFNGARFQDALHGIGTRYEAGPARRPDVRPGIERFFRTIDTQLMPFFQGRTFGNVVEKGDYASDAKANVTLDTLSKALVRWIVDVYHNTPHEGLGGETPRNAWDRLVSTYGVLPPPSEETMRAVFGVSTTRRIQNRGIRVMGLFYRRSEDNRLGKLRIKVGQRDVRIKIDRQNLGSILVRENVNGAEWFRVTCDLDEMEGVDALSWIQANRSMRRRNLDRSKLSEAVALGALHDIRRLGLESAKAADLGPSTMTSESLLEIEAREFQDVNIVAPRDRGGALNDFESPTEPVLDDEGPSGGDAASGPGAAPAGVSYTRRRGGVGKSFLED